MADSIVRRRSGVPGHSPHTQVQAFSISRSVQEFLARPHAGTVLATFARSCYLELDGRIIALVAPELLNGPLNIVLSPAPEVAFSSLAAGATVTSTDTSIAINNSLSIDLSPARIWNAEVTPWVSVDEPTLRRNLVRLRGVLGAEASGESFAHLLPGIEGDAPPRADALSRRATAGMHQLRFALAGTRPEAVIQASALLAGLGGGLTPSGDDVLVGALLCLAVWPMPDGSRLREAIVNTLSGRTTRISESYAAAAGRGEASEAWHRLLPTLPTPEADGLVPAARRITAFGEMSGSDMLAGFVLAIGARLENSRP